MSRKISRRAFLKNAGLGAAGMMAMGVLGTFGTANTASASESTALYKPGTYTGTGQGMGTVTATVTFDENSITDLVLDVSGETESIGQASADTIVEQIMSSQSTAIDGVSGATKTTDGVKEAVTDCINQALVNAPVVTETEAVATTTWRDAMEPVDASEIVANYSADIVVVGAGHAGIAAAREAAEQGKSVILLESQSESIYSAMGNAAGCLNSEYLLDKGCDPIDPVEFYNNWQLNTNNGANPKMIMKYCQNSGVDCDWFFTEMATKEEMDTSQTQYFPRTEGSGREKMLAGIGPHKFYSSSIDLYGDLSMTEVHNRNIAACVEAGGTVFYGMKGQYLLQNDDGDVIGLVAKGDEGYVQFDAPAVVLASGGFGGNTEMMEDLLEDLCYQMTEDDSLAKMGMDRDGSGIAMGYWAGGRIEQGRTIATMDGRTPWIGGSPGLSLSIGHPQGIWLDPKGKRFLNEFWGPIEFRNRPTLTMNRELFYCVYDANLVETLKYVVPSHGTKDPTESFLSNVQAAMDEAVAAGSAGYQVTDPSSFWYGAETLEEVVSFLDCDDSVKQNILDSVARYNEYVEAGADQEYGRDPEVMFPISQGPYFVQVVDHDSSIGNLMVTMGGLITDGDQQVLGADWKPISGLFATGNCAGGRFGDDYFSPIFGVSIGICISLGRDAGKCAVQFLDGTL